VPLIIQKKNKNKIKENQYKIRKIKEKKNKIVSVQASHNTAERNYEIYDKELLAIVEALTK